MVGNKWRLRAFQHLEALNEPLPSEDPGVPVDEAAAAILPALRAQGFRGGMRDLRRWFGNPNRYTPFIDEVAITRALQFEWPVIRGLSVDEKWEFYTRLASMDEPYDRLPDGGWERWLRGYAHDYAPAREGPATARRCAWMSGREIDRETVAVGVARARQLNPAAVAA